MSPLQQSWLAYPSARPASRALSLVEAVSLWRTLNNKYTCLCIRTIKIQKGSDNNYEHDGPQANKRHYNLYKTGGYYFLTFFLFLFFFLTETVWCIGMYRTEKGENIPKSCCLFTEGHIWTSLSWSSDKNETSRYSKGKEQPLDIWLWLLSVETWLCLQKEQSWLY